MYSILGVHSECVLIGVQLYLELFEHEIFSTNFSMLGKLYIQLLAGTCVSYSVYAVVA